MADRRDVAAEREAILASLMYHKWDATIPGHVFCSLLALVLFDELQRRLAARGVIAAWLDVRWDLTVLQETDVRDEARTYRLPALLRGGRGQGAAGGRRSPSPAGSRRTPPQ